MTDQTAREATCRYCGHDIIFEPWFRDGRQPNEPVWSHVRSGTKTCSTQPVGWAADTWPFATPATRDGEQVAGIRDAARQAGKACRCKHPADEHSVYGCADDCACEWMPRRGAARQAAGQPAATPADVPTPEEGIEDARKVIQHVLQLFLDRVPRDELDAETMADSITDAMSDGLTALYQDLARAETALAALPDPTTADDPTPLRWGLGDVLHSDDGTLIVCLSGPGPDRAPYWLELDPERAAALRQDLAGPDTEPQGHPGSEHPMARALRLGAVAIPDAIVAEISEATNSGLPLPWPEYTDRDADVWHLTDETHDGDRVMLPSACDMAPMLRRDVQRFFGPLTAAGLAAPTNHDTETCSHCKGTGADPEDEGDYELAVHMHNPTTIGPCPECHGSGKAIIRTTTDRVAILNGAADSLSEHAKQLSLEAEEDYDRRGQEDAQLWHQAADHVRRLAAGAES